MKPMSPEEMQSRIGEPLGVSDWLLIDQTRINAFARATGDHQYIHVDPVRAAASPMGGTIAHGFLTMSLMPVLMETSDFPAIAGSLLTINYGGERARFMNPVHAGKRVRGHFTLLGLEEAKAGQWRQRFEYRLEIEGEDKPAVIAEWIFLYLT